MLATATSGNLVAEKTHTFTAKSTDSIETVLGKLCVHDLLSLPVFDENHQILGMITIMDILIFISWGPYFASGRVDEGTTKLTNLDRPISQLMGLTAESRKLWLIEPTMPLSKLVEPFAHGLHRVLVPQKDDDGKNSYRVLSQSDVVSYLYKHKDEVIDIFSKKLSELGIKSKRVISVPSTTTALECFKQMILEKVAALAIVDNSNKIIGNISASDLRGINKRKLMKVVAPVTEFLITQYGFLRDPLTITYESSLGTAVGLLVNESVHRLWIVDDQHKPVGCFSLTDVINIFA